MIHARDIEHTWRDASAEVRCLRGLDLELEAVFYGEVARTPARLQTTLHRALDTHTLDLAIATGL